jgi:hypothetical protein
MTRYNHIHKVEVDEFLGRFYATIEVKFDYYPGEPMIWRTQNGDGYPGSSADINIVDARVINLIGATWEKDRKALEASGWAIWLDIKAFVWAYDNCNPDSQLWNWLLDEIERQSEN